MKCGIALRGVGATTPTSPLPARRLHRLTGRRGGCALSILFNEQIRASGVRVSELVKWQSGQIRNGVFAGATQALHVVLFLIDRIQYSTLDVGCSMLDVRFLFTASPIPPETQPLSAVGNIP